MSSLVDLNPKKAFNRLHRESFEEILRLSGIPTRCIVLIPSLYTGTENGAKCGGDLSSFFLVKSGVFTFHFSELLSKVTVEPHLVLTLLRMLLFYLSLWNRSGGS